MLPGHVLIEADAPGGMVFRQQLDLSAGANATVAITLLPSSAPAPVAPAPMVIPPSGPGVVPWVVVGFGGLGLAMGGVFIALKPAATTMPPAGASQAARTAFATNESSRSSFSTLSTVSFIVGGGAVAAGLIWYFVARPRAQSHASLNLWPEFAALPDGASAGIAGRF